MIGNPRYVNVVADTFLGIGSQCYLGGGILVAIGCVKFSHVLYSYNVWPSVYTVGLSTIDRITGNGKPSHYNHYYPFCCLNRSLA